MIDFLSLIHIFHAGFPGNGQRMEHGIGTAAHGHITCESIVDGVTGYDCLLYTSRKEFELIRSGRGQEDLSMDHWSSDSYFNRMTVP